MGYFSLHQTNSGWLYFEYTSISEWMYSLLVVGGFFFALISIIFKGAPPTKKIKLPKGVLFRELFLSLP